jgi:DNA polymerase-2
LNAQLAEEIERDHHVPSYLHLRCDKVYRRFLIPRLRGDTTADGRGRAKGYAGLRLGDDGRAELEVKGLEAARSDFTPLARRFQLELLARVFRGEDEEALRTYCRTLTAQMERGELDAELVYRKSLRRPAEEYDSETPPVRAARLLGWTEQRGRISYVVTRAGAEPVDARSDAPLDYEHYREAQLRPIAASVADALGWDLRGWLGDAPQLELFGV